MQDSLLGVGEVCGWTKGPPRHLETWWWDDEVGKRIDEKRKKFKEWQKAKSTVAEEALYESCKAAKKAAKKEVAKANARRMFEFGRESESGI